MLENAPLRAYNTFGLEANARFLTEISDETALHAWAQWSQTTGLPRLVLGGGSNILLTRDVEACVGLIRIAGIAVMDETDTHVSLRVGAGENWHNFVMHCISMGWGGVENLSLIPGTVGAAPIQNIGAYGVELKDVCAGVEAYEYETGEIVHFTASELHFGYRDSFFKREGKDRFVVTRVLFRLNKPPHALHTAYGDIQALLPNDKAADIEAVSRAVIQIRQSKLPDPAVIGNSGSFFKNPVIPAALHAGLKANWPEIPGYPDAAGGVKVPAAWLIERAGWKGYREGNFGVHDRQALVLVNHGGASGSDIAALSLRIIADVKAKFGVELEREVNVW